MHAIKVIDWYDREHETEAGKRESRNTFGTIDQGPKCIKRLEYEGSGALSSMLPLSHT